MTVTVLRGGNQIGGSIIEVKSETVRLILDAGSELDDTEPPQIPPIDGLFTGEPSCDAVLVSHGHRDHTGLLNAVLPQIPIYMGSKTYEILKLSTERTGGELRFQPILFDPDGARCDGSLQFTIGDISVTPFLCDHSAFDSHMFLLECGGESILYTGDFRSNGRLSFDALLSRLPSHVNKLITEGTTLGRLSNKCSETEADLENSLVRQLQGNVPAFVLAATTNIDRMVTVYRAARKSNRIMAVDAYQASVLCLAGKGIPTPMTHPGMRVIQIGGGDSSHEAISHFVGHTVSRSSLAKSNFVLCVRTSPQWKKWLKNLSKERELTGSTLFYSMWEGYQKQKAMQDFLAFCTQLGMKIVPFHTSGHADCAAIKKLNQRLGAPEIIPVHTEYPELLTGMLLNENPKV